MSYQVIARKWRPQTFEDVIGQSHVTTPLRNAISSDRVPHALLLTGPRGVGKTTLARILARCLNCEKGPTEEPCGTCDSCLEIISGRSTDVQEIDAASRTGVDDIREVIESIRYAPSPGKHRIFVVDEVHMLSKQAFNALLKTLEEPPPRSVFVFATTNPESIPFTVLSRCQRYDLRRISAQEVARCLGNIAEAEGVTISKLSLLSIAREGDGSMRDSQTLLDQVISFGGSEVEDAVVSQVLDLIDRNVLVAIIRACIDSNPKAALDSCSLAADKGSDPKRLGSSLIQLLRDLVVLSISPDGSSELVDGSDEDIAELIELAGRSNTSRLRRMFRILVSEQEDLAWAPQPFAVLEMAMVRLASLPEGGDISQLISRLDGLEKKFGGGGGAGPTPGGRPQSGGRGSSTPGGAQGASAQASAETAPAAPPEPIPAPQAPPAAHPASTTLASSASQFTHEAAQEATPEPGPRPTSRPTSERTSAPHTSPVAEPTAQAKAPHATNGQAAPNGHASRPSEPSPIAKPLAPVPEPSDLNEAPAPAVDGMATPQAVLDRIRAMAREHNQPLFHSLDAVELTERTENSLHFAANGKFYVKRLEDRRSELEALCQRFFGRPMQVNISQSSGKTRSQAATDVTGDNREQDRQRRHAALNHPSINLVLREMRGEIIEIHALDGPKSN